MFCYNCLIYATDLLLQEDLENILGERTDRMQEPELEGGALKSYSLDMTCLLYTETDSSNGSSRRPTQEQTSYNFQHRGEKGSKAYP